MPCSVDGCFERETNDFALKIPKNKLDYTLEALYVLSLGTKNLPKFNTRSHYSSKNKYVYFSTSFSMGKAE
jgi:hypothetical protein